MSSPEISGQVIRCLAFRPAKKKKKGCLPSLAAGSVEACSDILYTHLGTSPGISDPLIARSAGMVL